MTTLDRLAAWYARQCNGEWEHHQGVSIQSCDNPGWWIKIELKGTSLQSVSFERVAEKVDGGGFQQGPRWLDCRVADGFWSGSGDESKLERILGLFLSWAERHNS
jgi:Immunity protein 53